MLRTTVLKPTENPSNLTAQLGQQKELVVVGQLTAKRLEREVAGETVAFMIMLMIESSWVLDK